MSPTLIVDLLVHQFAEHARVRPGQPAVAGPGGAICYGELEHRASQIAAGLQAQGIGAGDIVGLCLDWTPDLLAALIGTWQVGAAYVPLDPALPAARLTGITDSARPAAVIAPPHWQSTFDATKQRVVAPAELLAAGRNRRTATPIDPAALAYVMYTSGTTGKPKGVMVSHGNIAGLFAPFHARFRWSPDDVWTLYHSYGFGYSVWETWGALTSGACLVPVPLAMRADPLQLHALLAQQRVTVLSQTPSAFRQTVLHEDFALPELPDLRLVALSGEALPAADLRRWFGIRGRPRPQLINTYAVTETGGQATCKVYEQHDANSGEPGDVGAPLPGVEVRLLDSSGDEVEAGAVGELYVGGPGIAQGYLGDAALAAERFVKLPTTTGARRFYRTGDLARRVANGSLVFTGRVDSQFKWRGYRIEAAEVEAALQAHPAVREAALAVRGDGDQARLVGYYVTGDVAPADHEPEFWPAVGPYQVYDQFLYDLMSTDDERLARFREAYMQAAPGRVVLDIGTGEHALLARLCAEAGARHVYAVEVLPEAAERAQETVARLGLAGRITVIAGDMASVQLPEPAEVATQGIIGNIGSADGIIPIWNAARHAFATDCIPVPARCRTWIAPAELPAGLAAQPAFSPLAQRYAALAYDQVGGPFDIRLCVRNFPADGLLADAHAFEDLDFSDVLAPPVTGEAGFVTRRAGRLDGFLLWTEVDTGAGSSLDYLDNQQAWLPVFFPLPEGGVAVAAREVIDVAWARDDASGPCPDYRIDARVRGEQYTYITRHQETELNGTALHRRLHASAGVTGPDQLRAWLTARVPAYMVPTAWIPLPALPLNANGKLDRDQLPAPGRARPSLAAPAVPPRDPLEEQLAGIWCTALALDGVGVDDNFFDLGGDSIAAVRVISMVQRELDAPVGLAALFDAPTVATLAARLRDQGKGFKPAAVEEGIL